MPIYNLRGIDVDFPFEAYDCQLVYMEKVIQSLQQRCNALLESPTGTGKTLCLLCATLAWRKSIGDFSTTKNRPCGSQTFESGNSDLPTIIYTSRTHSQLKQVIRELKLTNYRPKMTILGSRQQLCVHENVQSIEGRARDKACNVLRKKRSCMHYTQYSDYLKRHPELGNEPIDIEDLVNIGRKKGPCPYYMSRDLHKVADIVLAPYNYLIDSKRRESLTGISWREAILIFDEAHNLEGICADAASFDLPTFYLSACISEAKQCVDLSIRRRAIQNSAEKQCDPDDYAVLKALLMKLDEQIMNIPIGMNQKEQGFTRPGPYIYEFLSESLGLTFETASKLISTIDNAILLLEEENITRKGGNGAIHRLEGFKDVLETIFRDGGKEHAKFYNFHVQQTKQTPTDYVKANISRTLSWWCLRPGIAMEAFEKLNVRSIILTSGTLSPLDSFAVELNLNFPVRLENPHVIGEDQVWIGVVPTGPTGRTLNSSFKNRDTFEYKRELGFAIGNFARVVPDGLLVFFPSYSVMDQCIEFWKDTSQCREAGGATIWERICKNKQPVVEPRESATFHQAIEDFEMKLRGDSASGAVLFAVCRGKVSEGLDFADHAGRAVVIVGMPFAMFKDPKVQLKRNFLDQQVPSGRDDMKILTGDQWYFQQAARAMNQAVGRVIRHRHDYGAIILCDDRFLQQKYQSQMSYWIRPYIECYSAFGDVMFKLTRFFRDQSMNDRPNQKHLENLKSGILDAKDTERKTLTPPVGDAHEFPDLPVPSPAIRCTSVSKLHEVIPANRSSIYDLVNNGPSSKLSERLCSRKRVQDLDTKEENPLFEECQVIDLTSDTEMMSVNNKAKKDGIIASCSLKKSRLLESKVTMHGVPKLLNKIKEDGSCEGKSSTQSPKLERILTVDSTTQTFNSIIKTPKEDNSHSPSSSGNGSQKGPDYLIQVQTQLSPPEYKEFIGLLRALKNKTMRITPVLNSIAKLFSLPGRLSLLKGFRGFIPAKYQALYEQLVKAHETDADECNECNAPSSFLCTVHPHVFLVTRNDLTTTCLC